nr:MAG TPA: hypothetical protein [Caudoviricetes sp.]
MIFGKKKELTDAEKMKMVDELLAMRALTLNVRMTLDGIVVECKSNAIAKKAMLEVVKVSERDFDAAVDIVKKAGYEIGEVLKKYGDEVIDESEKKDKN